MDFRSVFKFLSVIGMGLGGFFIVDIAVGILYGEAVGRFVAVDALFFLFNLSVWLVLARYPFRLGIRESILSVNLLWLLIGVAGAMPLLIYTNVSPASAFFEAISGFTTTGATVYTDIEALPHLILFHRSLMHWLGGMGIIVLGVGLLSMINPSGSLSLFKAEATGVQLEKMTPKIKDTALRLWGIYLLLTGVDTLLLYGLGMSLFDAINHAFSTISTGGFSTKNSSMGAFDDHSAILWVTTLFMLLSGINFLAHLKLFYKDTSGYRTEEVRWYVVIFLFLAIALSMVHALNSSDGVYYSMTHAFFTIASVMTTTGFATLDYAQWGHFAIALVLIAMVVGGNAGSTAGGVKVIRYVILFKTLIGELRRLLHPSALASVFIDGVRLKERFLFSTFGFFFLYVLTVFATMLYIYLRGYDEMTAFSGALALVGNIGPGFSLVGPADNFGFFSDGDKLVFSAAMIIGRLECYTVFVLFSLSFWRRF